MTDRTKQINCIGFVADSDISIAVTTTFGTAAKVELGERVNWVQYLTNVLKYFRYTNTQIHKHMSTQTHENTNTQIHEYTSGIGEWLSSDVN